MPEKAREIPRCKRCAAPLAMAGQPECGRCGCYPGKREPIRDTPAPSRSRDYPARLYDRIIVQSATGVYAQAMIDDGGARDDGISNGWQWASDYAPRAR